MKNMLAVVVLALVSYFAWTYWQVKKERENVAVFVESSRDFAKFMLNSAKSLMNAKSEREGIYALKTYEEKGREMAEGKRGCPVLPDEKLKAQCVRVYSDFANANAKFLRDMDYYTYMRTQQNIVSELDLFYQNLIDTYPKYVRRDLEGVSLMD